MEVNLHPFFNFIIIKVDLNTRRIFVLVARIHLKNFYDNFLLKFYIKPTTTTTIIVLIIRNKQKYQPSRNIVGKDIVAERLSLKEMKINLL